MTYTLRHLQKNISSIYEYIFVYAATAVQIRSSIFIYKQYLKKKISALINFNLLMYCEF